METSRRMPMDEPGPDEALETFLQEVVSGLSQPQKCLPCKYFYDETGSRLFSRICETPEYYITRTEMAIMQAHVNEMAAGIGPHSDILEFGSGAGVKIRLLLDALEMPRSYTPMDISAEILMDSATELRQAYPDIAIEPIVGDYTRPFPPMRLFRQQGKGRKVIYFPGSTLSNFDPDEVRRFLKRVATLVGPGGGLLIGVDLVKPAARLHAAYNDAAGLTERFNKNLLTRINVTLDADFDPGRFEHRAFFHPAHSRVEMHLVSRCRQQVTIAEQCFSFEPGETIHTENSYKYTADAFCELASHCGFRPRHLWTDPEQLFSVHYVEVTG